jgi:hypothetical protein
VVLDAVGWKYLLIYAGVLLIRGENVVALGEVVSQALAWRLWSLMDSRT